MQCRYLGSVDIPTLQPRHYLINRSHRHPSVRLSRVSLSTGYRSTNTTLWHREQTENKRRPLVYSVVCYLVTNLDRQLGPGSLGSGQGRERSLRGVGEKLWKVSTKVFLKPFNQKNKSIYLLAPCPVPGAALLTITLISHFPVSTQWALGQWRNFTHK